MATQSPQSWRQAALIAILVFAAYSNSLSGPFILDDYPNIEENTSIRRLWSIDVLMPPTELPVSGRPLANLSLALNYAVGGLDVRGYHTVNVLLDAACALLVFGLVRRTLLLSRFGTRFAGSEPNVALAAAAIWAVHPLNTEAVNYITQRTELMMALFYLLTVYSSLRAATAPEGTPTDAAAGRWIAVAVMSSAAGMACKESMVTAPVAVLLFDRTFLSGSLVRALKGRPMLYSGLAASWLVLLALNWSGPRTGSAGFLTAITPWTYLLNQAVVITEYLELVVWPIPLVIMYGPPTALALRNVLPYAIVVVSLLVGTAVAFVRWRALGFVGLWFFLTLAPTSSLVPIATEVGAERRMYLPLVAVVAGAAVGARYFHVSSRLRVAFAISVIAALSVGTLIRNRDFQSPITLAQTAVDRRPTSAAHHMLGEELFIAGRNDEALIHLRKAATEMPRARYSFAQALLKGRQVQEATTQLESYVEAHALLLETRFARETLGDAYAIQQRLPDAVRQWRLVLQMNPDAEQRARIVRRLAAALLELGMPVEALEYLEANVALHPRDADAWTHLGVARAEAGNTSAALDAFRRAIEIAPDNPGFHTNMAMALMSRGDLDGATQHAEAALALQPDNGEARELVAYLRGMKVGSRRAR